MTEPQQFCNCNLKLKLCYDRWSVGQDLLVSSTHLGPKIKFLLLSDSCKFADVGRPLWQEDRSVIYNCCWPSPVQSFLGLSPAGLMTIFYCLRFETPQTWRGQIPVFISPQEQGGPVIPPGTGFPFRCLQDTELQWRYSNLPPYRSLPNCNC
jgi:hypothetical protein